MNVLAVVVQEPRGIYFKQQVPLSLPVFKCLTATDSQGHLVPASLWFFAVGTQQSGGKSAQLQVLPRLKQVCNMLGRRGRGCSWEWISVQVTLGSLRSVLARLEAAHPSPALSCQHWMHDWEGNWSINESCKSAWKLLGKQSLGEPVLLWVAVL